MNAEQFNKAFHVGQVVYFLENRSEDSKVKMSRQRVRIRGQAWDMKKDGRTVVMFIGRAGSFDVSRITRREISNDPYEQ